MDGKGLSIRSPGFKYESWSLFNKAWSQNWAYLSLLQTPSLETNSFFYNTTFLENWTLPGKFGPPWKIGPSLENLILPGKFDPPWKIRPSLENSTLPGKFDPPWKIWPSLENSTLPGKFDPPWKIRPSLENSNLPTKFDPPWKKCIILPWCRNKFKDRSNTWHSARAENGVSSEGFRTTVHPAANAGAALRVIIALGKFHLKTNNKFHHFNIITRMLLPDVTWSSFKYIINVFL